MGSRSLSNTQDPTFGRLMMRLAPSKGMPFSRDWKGKNHGPAGVDLLRRPAQWFGGGAPEGGFGLGGGPAGRIFGQGQRQRRFQCLVFGAVNAGVVERRGDISDLGSVVWIGHGPPACRQDFELWAERRACAKCGWRS